MKPPEVRYPLQPLIDALAHDMNPNRPRRGQRHDPALTGVEGLAVRLGVATKTIQRWRTEGIPDRWADRVALRVDLHPAIVWPDEYAAALDAPEAEPSPMELVHAAKIAEAAQRRDLLGLSKVALARLVGVASQTLDKWESGENWPSREMEARWFGVLDELERERLGVLLARHWIRG